jgi:hypothetical protein
LRSGEWHWIMIGSVFLDFNTAFEKLSWYGVKGGTLKWFEGYLEGRRQRMYVLTLIEESPSIYS